MAINPIRVLPRFSPAPLPSGNDARTGERVMLEIIQNELLTQRQKQAEVDDINKSFSTLLAKDQTTGLNPNIAYQKRALDKINAITQEASSKMQGAKDDPYKMNRAQQEYSMAINNDQDIIGARREAATLEKLYEHTTRLMEKGFINNDQLKAVLGEINNPDRIGPITFDNLDLNSLSKDVYAIGKDILDSRQIKDSVIERDEYGRIVAERTIETLNIPGKTEEESKDIHKKYLEERLKSDFPEEKARVVANNIVEDRFLKNTGKDYGSVKGTPAPKVVPKTYEEKQNQKLDEGGIDMKPAGGLYTLATRENDRIVLYDTVGKPVDAEEVWDTLTPAQKRIVNGAGISYDKYQVAGSNMKISGSGLSSVPLVGSVLSGADKAYNKANGVTTKAEISEDGYLDTNNPEVLSKVGIVIKYNKDTGKYTATDKSGKALKDSDFIVTGGAKRKDSKWIPDAIEGDVPTDGSNELNFRVKVNPITGATKTGAAAPAGAAPAPAAGSGAIGATGNPEYDFVIRGEAAPNMAPDRSINPYDSGRPSIMGLQVNGIKEQKEILSAVGKDGDWGYLVDGDSAARSKINKERDSQIAVAKGIANEKERNAEVVKISNWHSEEMAKINKETREKWYKMYDAMTPAEQQKIHDKQVEVVDREIYAPARKVFKDEFGIEIPTELRGLWSAMAGQSRQGTIGNKAILKIIAKKGDIKELIKEGKMVEAIDLISDSRWEYLNGLNLPNKKGLKSRVDKDRDLAKSLIGGPVTTPKADVGVSKKTAPASAPPKSMIDTFNIKRGTSNSKDSLNIK